MSILSEILATDLSSNIYEGSFARQNVYHNQVIEARGICEAGYMIEESDLLFYLSTPTNYVHIYRVGERECSKDTQLWS
jgi:hypothetical protein